MKRHLALLILGILASTVSQASDYLDDLGTIGLNVEASETEAIQINYPNYRLGGGTPPRRDITDCLMVDIQSSDREVTLAMKQELAERIRVEDGARFGNDELPVLKAEVKGSNVVFRLKSGLSYMTHVKVFAKNGKTLQSNLDEVVKAQAIPVGLVYVRACRF